MKTQKFDLFFKKVRNLTLTKSWNHLSFVNISLTLVIDTSMERSSRVGTTPWKPKNWFFSSKKLEFWLLTKSWNHHSYVNISPTLVIDRYINGKVFTSTTPWKPKNVKIFQKVRNWILSVPRVSVCREKKSPWLRQYQSYISNWYVNRKVFTSTTTWEPFFFSKKFEIELDLCWRAEINIQVGLNMHLYVDIGDASSSLWGLTSSLPLLLVVIIYPLWLRMDMLRSKLKVYTYRPTFQLSS